MQYNSQVPVHVDMMAAIYKGITGQVFLGASSSWETVGTVVRVQSFRVVMLYRFPVGAAVG